VKGAAAWVFANRWRGFLPGCYFQGFTRFTLLDFLASLAPVHGGFKYYLSTPLNICITKYVQMPSPRKLILY
jgi:hypothetical protein